MNPVTMKRPMTAAAGLSTRETHGLIVMVYAMTPVLRTVATEPCLLGQNGIHAVEFVSTVETRPAVITVP